MDGQLVSQLKEEEKRLKTQMVQDCQSLHELETVFDKICPIPGSRKSYESERLKEKIAQLRYFVNLDSVPFDKVPWNLITRTHGIRAKCMELFFYEKNEI